MTSNKTTAARRSPDRLAKASASVAPLSEAQLDQANGGLSLNFTKIEFKNVPMTDR